MARREATRIDGIPEYIRDGENGFLFDPGNTNQLAGLIDHVLQLSTDAYTKISSQARIFAENVLDYPNHYRILIDIIRSVREGI